MKEKTKGHFRRNFIMSFLGHLLAYIGVGALAVIIIVVVIIAGYVAAHNLAVTFLACIVTGVFYVAAFNAYRDAKSKEE